MNTLKNQNFTKELSFKLCRLKSKSLIHPESPINVGDFFCIMLPYVKVDPMGYYRYAIIPEGSYAVEINSIEELETITIPFKLRKYSTHNQEILEKLKTIKKYLKNYLE